MMWILLTFVLTSGLYVALLGFAICRVARHVQGKPEALKAVTEHVLLPLLGRQREELEKKRQLPRDVSLN